MHCSDEELILNNTENVTTHIKDCMHCQQRLWQLKQLKQDASKLPLFQPTDLAWNKVKQSLPVQKKNKIFTLPVNLVASFIIGIIVTQLGNNMWQEHLLSKAISLSNSYEHQLVTMEYKGVQIENKLWELSQIDKQLNQLQSKKSQEKLWRRRNEILKSVLESNIKNEVI